MLGMHQEEKWDTYEFGRSFKFSGLQFRLYEVRGLKSKQGAWYLHKLRDFRHWRYKGPQMNRDAREAFIQKAVDWAEEYVEEHGWVFVPQAKHFMRSTELPDSCQVLIEMEVLAQRGG